MIFHFTLTECATPETSVPLSAPATGLGLANCFAPKIQSIFLTRKLFRPQWVLFAGLRYFIPDLKRWKKWPTYRACRFWEHLWMAGTFTKTNSPKKRLLCWATKEVVSEKRLKTQ